MVWNNGRRQPTLTETPTAPQVTQPNPQNAAIAGLWQRNPAWVQLLGLCPLLAVSNSLVNALGLALASSAVLIGSNTTVAACRTWIPPHARLPVFMLIIATFTTCAVLLLQAFAFALYVKIALFVQIIVTNCMILARAEQFASRNSVPWALVDALSTAAGFAIALIGLGTVRELLSNGTIGTGLDTLFGNMAANWAITLLPPGYQLSLAALPAGAFIVAGLCLAAARSLALGKGKTTL